MTRQAKHSRHRDRQRRLWRRDHQEADEGEGLFTGAERASLAAGANCCPCCARGRLGYVAAPGPQVPGRCVACTHVALSHGLLDRGAVIGAGVIEGADTTQMGDSSMGMIYDVPTSKAGVMIRVETLTEPAGTTGTGQAEIRGLHVEESSGPAWDFANELGGLIGVRATRPEASGQ